MASIYEEMGGTYYLDADGFYYPGLLPPEEKKAPQLPQRTSLQPLHRPGPLPQAERTSAQN